VSNAASCSVCGRTILKGERTRTYLTPDGDRRTVCDLCRSRAEALHWVWAEVANQNHPGPALRRRDSLVAWLRSHTRRRPARSAEPAGGPARNGAGAAAEAPQRVPDPAARGARVGRAGAIPEPGTRLERAVSRFNESEHARTVAGLSKTLGPPLVSVGAAAGSPNEIRLTVAWELSWYQWGVDIGDELRPVFQIDKGVEIDQLDPSARQWNAFVGRDGKLGLTREIASHG
jgi:hypothetical protein